jgi:hypothetical protein
MYNNSIIFSTNTIYEPQLAAVVAGIVAAIIAYICC